MEKAKQTSASIQREEGETFNPNSTCVHLTQKNRMVMPFPSNRRYVLSRN